MNREDFDLVTGLSAGVLLTLLGLLGLYVTRSHRDTIRFQQRLFFAAMAIRFSAAVLLHATSLYAVVVGTADASGWEGGRGFKETIDRSLLGPLAIPQEFVAAYQGINRGYGTLLGLYFYFTRLDSELSAAALSCFSGALAVVLSYRLARSIFSEAVARRTAWSVCLFPSMIIWSIQAIKEPIVILSEMAALYACTVLRRRFSVGHLLLWLLTFLVLLPLRFYAAYTLTGVILLALLVPDLGRGRYSIGAALAGGGLLFLALSGLSGSIQAHQEAFASYDVERIQGFREAVSAGEGSGSGVHSDYDLRTSRGLVLGTLVGTLHLLLAPFPWQLGGGSARLVLTAPEMAVWWWMVVGGLGRGLSACLKRQAGDVLPLLLFTGALGLVYSMMFGNIGIIYRQRAQLLPYLLMITQAGFEAKSMVRGRGKSAGRVLAVGSDLHSPPKPSALGAAR